MIIKKLKPSIDSILRYLMTTRGVTQTQVSLGANLPQSTIQKILTSKTKKPCADTLRCLARYFDVEISQLIGEKPLACKKMTSYEISGNSSLIPLLDWDMPAKLTEVMRLIKQEGWFHWVITHKVKKNAYALKVQGLSMAPQFPAGTLLTIQPDLTPEPFNFVIVQYAGSNVATCKQYCVKNDIKYFKPINPIFQCRRVTANDTIYGVVTYAAVDY